ncbi:MAG: hypothetical protein ACXITV_07685 [Luteibaculaceae bacterium]
MLIEGINNLKRRPFFALVNGLTLLFALIYFKTFTFLRVTEFDSPSFIAASKLLFNLEGGADIQGRLSKPLSLLFPGILNKLFAIDAEIGFIIQNLVFFFLFANLLIYYFKLLRFQPFLALLGFILVFTAQPFAIFSLQVLTDITGWFFILLGLVWFEHTQIHLQTNLRNILIGALICAFGVLFKESAIVLAIYFFVLILLSHLSLVQKIKAYTVFYSVLLMIISLNTLIIDSLGYQNVFSRIADEQNYYGAVYYTVNSLKQVYRTLDLHWIFVLIGFFFVQYKELRTKALLITTCLVFLVQPLIHPFIADRILFMAIPFLFYFAVKGLENLKGATLYVFAFGTLNVGCAYLIYRYNTQGLLLFSLLIAFVSLIPQGILVLRNQKKKGDC